MACRDPVTLAELEEEVNLDSFSSDAAKQAFLDRITGKVYEILGHSFGVSMRIYHDEGVAATAATVEVTALAVVLVITGGANAGTYPFTFAAYATIEALVDAIEALDKGWQVTVLETTPWDQPSANLAVRAATDAFGADARVSLCFAKWRECGSGNNEHYFFVTMPVLSVSSVYEDGILLVENTGFRTKRLWLARHCCVGGGGNCWRPSYWSCVTPCNVCVTYVPRWFKRRPDVLRNAIIGLSQLELDSSGGFKSERMGDYSYMKGDFAVAWSSLMSPLVNYMLKFTIGA